MKAKVIISGLILMVSTMASAQTKETAVLFSGTEFDESYLLADKVSVTFYEDGKGNITLNGEEQTEFIIVKDHPVTVEFKDAFKLKANQDPDNTSDYYTTFYTEDGAYKVPSEANAYAGKVETKVIKLTEVGSLIHKKEPVILKASTNEFTLMPSANNEDASVGNNLKGTVEKKILGDNDYALSLGQYGVGFYLWKGEEIAANKAYLPLGSDGGTAKAFTFKFDDGEADAIHSVNVNDSSTSSETNDNIYNLNGMRVRKDYKGIVIVNGKKVIK